MFGLEFGSVIAIAVALVILLIEVYLMLSLYKKCPPNQAMIVSGMYAGTGGSSYKIIVGGAAIVLPMVQQVNLLSLEVRSLKMQPQLPMFTEDGAPLKLTFAANFKIKSDALSIANAAERVLGKTEEEIDALVSDVLMGIIRTVVANITVEQLKMGFDVFVPGISEKLEEKIGITCVSLSIKNCVELDRATIT